MKKNGQIYIKMFLSYMVILCVPIIISVFLYQYTYNIVRQQAEYYSGNLIETVRSSCDRELRYYQSFLHQLKLDPTVKVLLNGNNYDSPDAYWNFYQMKEKIVSMHSAMRDDAAYCPDIFVYLKNIDKIICTKSPMNYEDYCDSIVLMDDELKAELFSFLEESNSGDLFMVAEEDEEYILMAEPVINSKNKSSIIVGIWLNTEALSMQTQSVDWSGGMDWIMLDSNNKLLRTQNYLKGTEIDFEKLNYTEEQEIIIGTKKYLVKNIASEVYDGRYMLFTPSVLVNHTANKIRDFHLVSLVIVLLSGLLGTKIAMKVNYSPIKNLMDFFIKGNKEQKIENEYQYLQKQISLLFEKNDSAVESIQKSKKTIRNYSFEKLLTSSSTKTMDSEYAKEIYEKFANGKNIVLLFGIKEQAKGELAEEEIVLESQLKRFIMANVLAEGIGEFFEQETQETEENVIMIVHVGEKENEYLQSIVVKMLNFISDKFKFDVYAVEGGSYIGIDGIRHSYLEACQAERFGVDLNESYIRYDEIKDRTMRKYQYTFEIEEQIIGAIRGHNANLANSFIDNILERSFGNKAETTSELLTCLLYDIFTTLLKASEDLGLNLSRLMMVNHILANASLDEIRNYFHKIVEELCEDKEETITAQGQEVCLKVLAYIRDNFTDMDLNISQIALQFHMTPAYLSIVFKKQTGESILDVIRNMRIDYAKKLLEEGLSVAEVSEKAGFRESSTFIKVFKNSVGVTPGQMRKVGKK